MGNFKTKNPLMGLWPCWDCSIKTLISWKLLRRLHSLPPHLGRVFTNSRLNWPAQAQSLCWKENQPKFRAGVTPPPIKNPRLKFLLDGEKEIRFQLEKLPWNNVYGTLSPVAMVMEQLFPANRPRDPKNKQPRRNPRVRQRDGPGEKSQKQPEPPKQTPASLRSCSSKKKNPAKTWIQHLKIKPSSGRCPALLGIFGDGEEGRVLEVEYRYGMCVCVPKNTN